MGVLYSKFANCYDSLYKDKNYDLETDYLFKLINNNSHILSIGCGTDIQFRKLLEKHNLNKVYYIGIDKNKNMLNNLKLSIKNKKLYCFDISKIPLRFIKKHINYFDIIYFLGGVANYLSYVELIRTINICKKMIRSNGNIIFDIPYNCYNYQKNHIDIANTNNLTKLSLSTKSENCGVYQTIFFIKKNNELINIQYDEEKIFLHNPKDILKIKEINGYDKNFKRNNRYPIYFVITMQR